MLTVSSGFDAGNIEVVSLQDSADIQLHIRKDNGSDFFFNGFSIGYRVVWANRYACVC